MTEYRDLDGDTHDVSDITAEQARFRRATRIARVLATMTDSEVETIYAGLIARVNRDFEAEPRKIGDALASSFDQISNRLSAGDPFFDSKEWLQLRYDTLRRYGGNCMCCGTDAASGAIIQVDHIKPRSKFPKLALDPNNLQVLCGRCNHGKSNKDETDWRKATRPPAMPVRPVASPRIREFFAGPRPKPLYVSTAETRARENQQT